MTKLKASISSSLSEGLSLGDDGQPRCSWALKITGFVNYHDKEWGFPVEDEYRLFEKICLEGFQSGLSWKTVLDKRPAFREVFLDFNFEKIAQFDQKDVHRLMDDARIIRHRGKIEATINNARQACKAVETYGSLAALVWQYEPSPVKAIAGTLPVPSKTEHSAKFAVDLKKLGWRFFGPTTAYAFMQAMGLVNDHVEGCIVRDECEASRAKFVRPGYVENSADVVG
jgi:DNA-3-methyladenine glycosylase I